MDILSLREVEADHAENGQIAVEMFRQSAVGEYSAILMDVRMPEMDGTETMGHIREGVLNRETPVICLTADAVTAKMISKLPGSLMNAVFAFIVAPLLHSAVKPALKHAGLYEKL